MPYFVYFSAYMGPAKPLVTEPTGHWRQGRLRESESISCPVTGCECCWRAPLGKEAHSTAAHRPWERRGGRSEWQTQPINPHTGDLLSSIATTWDAARLTHCWWTGTHHLTIQQVEAQQHLGTGSSRRHASGRRGWRPHVATMPRPAGNPGCHRLSRKDSTKQKAPTKRKHPLFVEKVR